MSIGGNGYGDLDAGEVQLDQLLGRQVRTESGKTIGRIEEFRTAVRGGERIVAEYVLGGAGLMERLGMGVRQVLGRAGRGYIAKWDQIDVSHPERPRLLCSVEELRKL